MTCNLLTYIATEKYDKASIAGYFPEWGFMGAHQKLYIDLYCQVNYMSYSIPDDMVACELVKKSWK